MKTLFSTIVCFALVAIFMGCSNTQNIPVAIEESGPTFSEFSEPATVDKGTNTLQARSVANPVWTWAGITALNSGTRGVIRVEDLGATNITVVYMCATTAPRVYFATWSASGGSVSFVEMPQLTGSGGWYSQTAWGNYYIKAVDVTVGNNGNVQTSNTRTIFTATTNDSSRIVAQTWCPATSGSGAGKIAFMVLTPTQSKICTVPVSGGAATTIYTVNNADARFRGESLTWSPDGTKLAFSQSDGSGANQAIKIIDLSGNVVTSLLDGSTSIGGCRWSNTGLNKISYWSTTVANSANVADYNLYTINADGSGSPQLLRSQCYGTPAWSPNNLEVAANFTGSNGNAMYRINCSTLNTTYVRPLSISVDWK